MCCLEKCLLSREMFVDTNRAMAVVLGEKDNKDVLEKRKRSEKRERMKMNRLPFYVVLDLTSGRFIIETYIVIQ